MQTTLTRCTLNTNFNLNRCSRFRVIPGKTHSKPHRVSAESTLLLLQRVVYGCVCGPALTEEEVDLSPARRRTCSRDPDQIWPAAADVVENESAGATVGHRRNVFQGSLTVAADGSGLWWGLRGRGDNTWTDTDGRPRYLYLYRMSCDLSVSTSLRVSVMILWHYLSNNVRDASKLCTVIWFRYLEGRHYALLDI